MEKKRIDASHFMNYINLGGFSRREKEILFTETRVRDNEYLTDLCVLDMETLERRKLTEETAVDLYQWDGPGKIIFTGVLEEEDVALQAKQIPITAFYRLDTVSGQRELLFRVHKKVSDFHKASDNQYFLLCSDMLRDDLYLAQAQGDWEKFSKIKEEEADYFIAEEVPFWTNAAGYCDGKRGRIFQYRDGSLTQMTPDNFHVTAIKGYSDRYVIYAGVESGGVQHTTGKLYLYDIQREETVVLDDSQTYIYTYLAAVSEKEILVCRSDRKLHGEYQDEYIDLIDLETGAYLRKNPLGDYHIYDNVTCDITYLSNWLNKLTRDENGTWFLATEMESSKVFYWADNEELPRAMTTEIGKVIDYEVAEGKLFLIAMRKLGGTELYVHDLKTGEENRLSEYNTALEEVYQYAPVERLPFINSNGVEIQGWYIKPVDFKEGEKYPTVLFIHGGPQCAYGEIFNHDMQLMAADGYGVLFCNPTGSEGRGGDFADIRMQYGTIDAEDLTGFVKYAAQQLEWIDQRRLGVTGGSYGGIMTNWLIGHSDLFCAAVSDRGVCNNISDFGLSDIGVAFGQDTFETTPWGNVEYLWETSALKYAPDIKTPVLFIHGKEDYRCPYDSALQMHTALTYFGTPSKVIVFKGENHELCRSGQPVHRVRRLQEMKKWFDTYMK